MARLQRRRSDSTPASWLSLDADIQLVFSAEGRRFAVSVSEVAEIFEFESLRPIPGCPQEIPGILDLRGRIITLLNVFGAASLGWRIALIFQKPYAHLGLLVPPDMGIAFRRAGEATAPLEDAEPWLEGLWEHQGAIHHVLTGRRLAGFARARVVESFKQ